jgi:hypothetical protein
MRGMKVVRTSVLVCGALAWTPMVSAQVTKPGTSAPAPSVASKPGVATVQGFSVVLLLGDLQGGTTADNVPPAARKALADMKDFLPYKSYRLLDTAWTLASNNGVRSTMRLRGLENQEFELNLNGAPAPAPSAPARLNLSFGLSEGGPDAAALYADASRSSRVNEQRRALADLEARLSNFDRENERADKQLENVPDADRREALARRQEARVGLLRQLERVKAALAEQQAIAAARGQQQETDTRKLQLDTETRKAQVADLEARRKLLESQIVEMNRRLSRQHPTLVAAQLDLERLTLEINRAKESAGQQPAAASGRRIIDTSFSMDVGETVVVGTSRLGGGDRAIIALLTAVPRGQRK